MSHKKVIYIDDHKREDVVKYHGEYLKIIKEYIWVTTSPDHFCSNEDPALSTSIPSERKEKKLVMIIMMSQSSTSTKLRHVDVGLRW